MSSSKFPAIPGFSDTNILPFTACDHCREFKWNDNKPKRCTGCGKAVYCNRECQKAAWPRHKLVCRSAPHTTEEKLHSIGYGSSMALTSALMEWNRFHRWALATLADAVIYLNGGIDAVMSSNPPKALLIHVTPRHRMESGKNPANAFDVEQSLIATIGEHPLLRDKRCEDLQTQCELLGEMVRTEDEWDDPTFVGILPGVYAITGTQILSYERFPVYRLPVRHVKDDPRNARTRDAMQSLVDTMMAAIATDIVFMRPENRAQEKPDLGQVVRSKKTWRWDRRPADWDAFNTVIGRKLPVTVGLTPAKILTLFDHRCSKEKLRTT